MPIRAKPRAPIAEPVVVAPRARVRAPVQPVAPTLALHTPKVVDSQLASMKGNPAALPRPGDRIATDSGGPIYHYMPNEKTIAKMMAALRKDKAVVANYKMVVGSFGHIRNREMAEAWRRYQAEIAGEEIEPLPGARRRPTNV